MTDQPPGPSDDGDHGRGRDAPDGPRSSVEPTSEDSATGRADPDEAGASPSKDSEPRSPTHPKVAAAAGTQSPPDTSQTTGDDTGAAQAVAAGAGGGAVQVSQDEAVPPDVRNYDRFQKVDKASYERVNDFLRERTYITAREWAIARLCADFRTATGVEMTKIGEHLPELVPFMTDTYSPQAVNQARSAFEEKVRMAGATFLYGAMSGFFTADELDDLMYEVTEVAKFLLEVEGVELTVEEELEAEERISSVMREVRRASEGLRYEGVECPECDHEFTVETTN